MTSGNKVREWVKNMQIVRMLGFKNNNKTHSGNTKKTHRQQQRHCYIIGVRCTCQPRGTGPKSIMIDTLNMPSRLRRRLRHEGYYTVNDVLTVRNVTALLVVEKSELAKHRPIGH